MTKPTPTDSERAKARDDLRSDLVDAALLMPIPDDRLQELWREAENDVRIYRDSYPIEITAAECLVLIAAYQGARR